MTTQTTSGAQDTTKAPETTATSTTGATAPADTTKTADQATKSTDASSTTTDTKAADTKAADTTATSKTDDKKADDAKADDKKADDKTASKAPEKYDLKLSENSLLDAKAVDKVAAIARERGLSNEEAQKVLSDTEQQVEAERESNIKAWESEVKADTEIGGSNFEATQANVSRFAQRFAPKDSPIAELLHKSGYGSHPAVVRLMNDIGKAMGEDKPLSATGGSAGASKDTASLLYDHPSNFGSKS